MKTEKDLIIAEINSLLAELVFMGEEKKVEQIRSILYGDNKGQGYGV